MVSRKICHILWHWICEMMHQTSTWYGCMHCRPIANCFYTQLHSLSKDACISHNKMLQFLYIAMMWNKKASGLQEPSSEKSSKCIPYWLLGSSKENFKIAQFLIVCIFKYNHMLQNPTTIFWFFFLSFKYFKNSLWSLCKQTRLSHGAFVLTCHSFQLPYLAMVMPAIGLAIANLV